MAKKKVYVSFDRDTDTRFRLQLEAWDPNPGFEFAFSNIPLDKSRSQSVEAIKTVLARTIDDATYTLVVLGKHINRTHKLAAGIGYVNWQHFEIAKSKEHKNRLVGVQIDEANPSPCGPLDDADTTWAAGFERDAVIDALIGA